MSDNKGGQGKAGAMNIDAAFVRELADMLDETGLTEIEVEDGDRKIRVARTAAVAASAPFVAAPAPAALPSSASAAAPAANAPPAPAPTDVFADATKSPMVGTVYLAPDPAAGPFVTVGGQVAAGETVLIIEAMKVMNPITAPHGGTLVAMHVENNQPVEYDQPLFTIR